MPVSISIWEPHYNHASGRLEFVRPEVLPLGDHYAERQVIPADKPAGTTRICFFGESAAAGYLYAPHLTPAKVLEHHLNTAADTPTFEVIDLARTNERLETLVTTAEQSLQLDPDMLVVFTGNNWNLLETPELSPYFPSVNGRRAFAAALRQQGFLGLTELASRKLMDKVGAAFGRLHALTQQAGIPLVLVIPEVNLADWETRQPAPWLSGEASGRWYTCYFDALEAVAQNAWERLFELADQMLTFDGEQCPTSWRLLALAHHGLGNLEQARLAAEMEISTAQYATLGFLGAPQIPVLGQELQRRAAAFHQFRLADLPRILPEITGTSLSNRRLFADYCHLTAEGMHLAMGVVAAEILEWSWADLLPTLTPLSIRPESLATARFGAAVHTAHRHLPVNPRSDIVVYWCKQALEASPDVAAAMVAYVEARCVPLPAVLTAAQQHNLTSPFVLQYQHGWRYDYLDAALIAAVCEVLAERDPAAVAHIQALLLKWRGVGSEPLDLLDGDFYLWEPLARFYPETMPYADITHPAFYRTPWPESALALVTDGTAEVQVALTGRLPLFGGLMAERAGEIEVWLNQRLAAVFTLTHEWQTGQFSLSAELLRRGLNQLTIKWPSLPDVKGINQVLVRLEQGETADLYPVFGELFRVAVWQVGL